MLVDTNANKALEQDGALVIPFLMASELEAVVDFYNTIQQEYELKYTHGMHMTLWHSDVSFKLKIQNGLLQLLQAAYLRNFTECRRLNNIFMVKQSHTEGDFAIHNDWSIVDETKYTSINVWIPLQDVTQENGGLWVLKGSHKIDMPYRGGGALLPDFTIFDKELKPYRCTMNVKAGEALLFYHKTIHGSYPNKSDQDRVVCTFSIIPQEAALQICFQKDENSPLEIHEPMDDFNYKYNDLLNDTNEFAPTKESKEIYHSFKQKTILASDIILRITKK